jgi:SPP1 gp7 family putative phage head morphogenesis protein
VLASFEPSPHEEAIALIKGKAVVTREVFDGLLPELRARAFTITGVEGANVLQRVRDVIAGLPQGGAEGTWDKVKAQVASELETYLGAEEAQRRATLLVRTHGFQAFQASNWRVAQEDADTTHLQYLATEDERVRASHLALNGLILPKDDPFWQTHFPPWDWGCRCRTRAMNPDLVDMERDLDAQRNPDDQLVLEGPALDRLRNGTLERAGQTYDVTVPVDKTGDSGAYQWHPDNLAIPVEEIAKRYDSQTADDFTRMANGTEIMPGMTLSDWLARPMTSRIAKRKGTRTQQKPVAIAAQGPKDATAFGRDRSEQIRRMQKESSG